MSGSHLGLVPTISTMEEPDLYDGVSILEVLAVWPCARAIFEHVSVRDLVRSERVSKDWQQAVYNHLQSSRKCKLYSGVYFRLPGYDFPHYIIEIKNDGNSWSILSKTVEKLRPYIVSLKTNCCEAEHLKIIGLNCPHLKEILIYDLQFLQTSKGRDGNKNIFKNVLEYFSALKKIIIIRTRKTHELLSQASQTIEYENIEISECRTTGCFLKHIKLNSLKSLDINCSYDLNISNIECMAYKLQNLTELRLDCNNISVLQNIHKVLMKLPKLETLSLRGYRHRRLLTKINLLESFSQLGNLKRLILANNAIVDDELVKVVVRDCKKLEYLDITGFGTSCLQSIAAVCRRPAPADTILCLGLIRKSTSAELAKYIKQFTYIGELQKLGCIEVTEQWLKFTARASKNYTEVQLRQACTSVETGQPSHKLKIKLES